MQIKCEFCGQLYDAQESACPHCGAANPMKSGTAYEGETAPLTIEELKAYCQRHGLTSATTRFFIGEDYKKPKAFGIYQDTDGKFIVYKNKANGQRAIRYEGYDEAHAVNEIYQRLLQEMDHQIEVHRAKSAAQQTGGRSVKKTNGNKGKGLDKKSIAAVGLFAALFIGMMSLQGFTDRHNGYYYYNDQYYYCLGSDWYLYNETTDYWYTTSKPSVIVKDYDTYRVTEPTGIFSFEDTTYYYDYTDDDDDEYDSDSDWDWDSDSTDWDSDW